MAVKLPNGAIVSIADEYESDIVVSTLSNASPAVATAEGHGLQEGDYIELTSGWNRINDQIIRVGAVTEDAFELEGIDTTDTEIYPTGSGAGSVRKITGWIQIQQVTNLETSGGEMQFAEYSFLENDYNSQIPTTKSAQSMTLTIGDDPSLQGYKKLQKVAATRKKWAVRFWMPDKSEILYNGYISFNETPSTTKDEIMTVTATVSLIVPPLRYAGE